MVRPAVLKLNFAEETRETNPFIKLWSAPRPVPRDTDIEVGTDDGSGVAPVSTARFMATIVLSCVTCTLGFLLAGYGLFEITRPLLSLPMGISLAGLGATVVIGSAVVIQMSWTSLTQRLRRHQRVVEVTTPQESR
jgi:hypothetical protein